MFPIKLAHCVHDLQKIKEMNTPYLCKMKDDFQSSEF